MANKEINIFSVSFLDLLSGALAAVLILFVIVPKMSQSQIEALEEMERLQVEQAQLEDLVEQARNSIPTELYEQITAQLEAMQQTIETLNGRVNELQSQNARLQEQNSELQESNARLQEQVAQLQEELRETSEELEETREELENSVTGDGSVLGVNAQLAIACGWNENCDVDLHITDINSGVTCYYNKQTTDFGRLQGDIRTRSAGDTTYEMFYQSVIVPGRYRVIIHIYNDNKTANVSSFAVINPGKRNEQKLEFKAQTLTPSHRKAEIGILVVTQNSITLQ